MVDDATRTERPIGVRRTARSLSRQVRRWSDTHAAAAHPGLASWHGADLWRRRLARRRGRERSELATAAASERRPGRGRGAVGMSQPENSNAMRYGSRYPSTGPALTTRACPVCGGTPPSNRSVYCKPACKQLAYRLRHQSLAAVDTGIIRKQLQRQRLLVAHTVYQCPSCGEQSL